MNPQELQQAIKQTCQESLLAYSSFTNKRYSIQPHHRVIAETLQRVERGELKKVMFFMPPRFGKSELASVNFPSWYLGRNPDKSIMLSSYSADLSDSFSRKARNLFDSDEHKFIFGTELAKDSQSVSQWHTSKEGSFVSAGVGGGVTGKGGDILLTDDPVKNAEDADSPLKRQKAWDWYQTTFRTRKMNDQSSEVIMMTRWHEDDLAGRLLAAENDWYRVIVPALKKDGSSNWESRFSKEYFEKLKREVGPRVWASLYMQNPKPIGGGLFKREYFTYYSQMELDSRKLDIMKMQRITFVDPAISIKQTADYTAIVTIGILGDDIYILDIVKARLEPNDLINQIFEVVRMFNPHKVGVESVAFQKMLIQEIRKQMVMRGQSFVLEEIHPMGEKEARISSLLHTPYITGKIHHLHGGENVSELEEELLSFPLGTHDDTIDGLAGALKMISLSQGAIYKANQRNYIFPNITKR